MFMVDLRLPPDDLAVQMSDMRGWLDGHHVVETSGFSYEKGSYHAVARLAFGMKREAEEFAERFAGRVTVTVPVPPAALAVDQALLPSLT